MKYRVVCRTDTNDYWHNITRPMTFERAMKWLNEARYDRRQEWAVMRSDGRIEAQIPANPQ